MNDRNFSRRRRGGMRFRPAGGLGHGQQQRTDHEATQARADATGATAAQDKFYEHRHTHEIERAENIAAGLPPEGLPAETPPPVEKKHEFRQPHLEIPAEVQEEKQFEPVSFKEQPKGIVESLRSAANTLVKRVQRLIRPVKRIHKEVVINAETLETRVAVSEEGRLEEFTIERTMEERLVGSIFKGKVRNLQDDLKAAFVDIGFEKNAFLHYWDIIPSSFDSGVEIVERPTQRDRRREKPKITQKDIPRVYPPGSEIIVQVTKGPIGTKGPRVTTNVVLPGRYLVLLPNSEQSGISRKIEDQHERQRLKRILRELSIPEGMGVIMRTAGEDQQTRYFVRDTLRELSIPEGMGVIMRTAGEDQQTRYFVRDLALLLDEWKLIQERIKTQGPASCVFQEPDLIERTVRDFLTEDVERIVVDNSKAYDRMRDMISRISKRSAEKVKLYADPQPIFDRFNITRQLENAFSRQVHLKSGGYLVIDETEALVPIDVNTGRHKGGKDQETSILKVNMEAADEIARQ